jgi:ribonucleotide monophosphatase NagD (HAD superfamily)
MIGDNLDTDIQFAINNNLDSIVVLSGCTTLEQAISSKKATFIANSLF